MYPSLRNTGLRENVLNVVRCALGVCVMESWKVCLHWWEVPGGARFLVIAQLWPWTSSVIHRMGQGALAVGGGGVRLAQRPGIHKLASVLEDPGMTLPDRRRTTKGN